MTRQLPVAPKGGHPCTLCKLGKAAHVQHTAIPARTTSGEVLTDPEPVKYLLVGEAPGAQENAQGRPFVGRSGWRLDTVLRLLSNKGLDLHSVAITNAVRCQPKDNKKPPKAAKTACLPYLQAEIEAINPECIVCLGGQAAATLFGENTFAVEKNRRERFEYNGIPTYVTYHPSYVNRLPAKLRAWAEDLYAYLVGVEEEREPDFEVRLINKPEQFDKFITKWSGYKGNLGLDMEWEPGSQQILLIGLDFGLDGPVWVLPAHHPESELPGDEVVDWVQELVNRRYVTVVGHNLKADLSVLFPEGESIRCKADDSMMWHYLLDENRSNRKLRTLAKEFTPYRKLDDDVDSTQIISTPLREAARYNGVDVALPPLVIGSIENILCDLDQFSPRMVEFHKRLVPYLGAMTSAGIAIDIPKLREVSRTQAAQLEKLRKELKELAPTVKNLNSHQQLSAYLFGTNGGFDEEKLDAMGVVDPLNLTVPDVKDNWGECYASTAKHVLEKLPENIDFVTKLRQFRSLDKELSTYVQGVEKNLCLDDGPGGGIVRPDIFPASMHTGGGTVSGRLTIKNPPMQTVDKSMPVAQVFTTRYEDGFLVGIDGSQMELRWGAWGSQDPYLCGLFRQKGGDPHDATAEDALVERKLAKTINFASIYGCSQKKLLELGLPLEVARRVKNTLETNWVALYAFEKDVAYEVLNRGITRTPYGRVRRIPGAKSLWSHEVLQGVNFRFQAPASDICHLLGWSLMVEGAGVLTPIFTNHDGLYYDVAGVDRAEALDIIEACVVKWHHLVEEVLGVRLTIPFEFVVETGPNLGELTEEKRFECQCFEA